MDRLDRFWHSGVGGLKGGGQSRAKRQLMSDSNSEKEDQDNEDDFKSS